MAALKSSLVHPLYSGLAIETSLTLRVVFGLPLRQTEGFVGSLLRLLGLDHLPVPDHSTLSRRARSLKVRPKKNPRPRECILYL